MESLDLNLTVARLGYPVVLVAAYAFAALLLSSYVKIATVLSILKAGLGVNGLPSAMVTGGLALALSFFVMYPTIRDSGQAVDAALRAKGGVLSDADRSFALDAGVQEWKKFLQKNAQPEELQRFAQLAAEGDRAQGKKDQGAAGYGESYRVLAPAFFVSELRQAFKIGLSIFVPFLIIDLLCAVVLALAGVDSLNPHLVGLPLKLLLFVAVDGWTLITTNLAASYLQ